MSIVIDTQQSLNYYELMTYLEKYTVGIMSIDYQYSDWDNIVPSSACVTFMDNTVRTLHSPLAMRAIHDQLTEQSIAEANGESIHSI